MKALFKNIQGIRMVILITLAMTAVVLTAFGVSFEVSGSVEKGAFAIVIAIVIAIANKYKMKLRFCLYIFITETILVVFAMTIWLPYLALIVAGLLVAITLLLAESKLRLWLVDNPPPEVRYTDVYEERGFAPFRSAKVLISSELIPDS